MPTRIYDIARKLRIESKDVLAKAKALGIAAAELPSSSLDLITAKYLEEELLKDRPELSRPLLPPSAAPAAATKKLPPRPSPFAPVLPP